MSSEEDHDLLIEIRSDVKHLIEKHEELKSEFHSECMPRLAAVEKQQIKWIGRDGAIVAFLGLTGGAIISVLLGGN